MYIAYSSLSNVQRDSDSPLGHRGRPMFDFCLIAQVQLLFADVNVKLGKYWDLFWRLKCYKVNFVLTLASTINPSLKVPFTKLQYICRKSSATQVIFIVETVIVRNWCCPDKTNWTDNWRLLKLVCFWNQITTRTTYEVYGY